MTNELSFPHTPSGPKGPRGFGEACPNPEMLSAYLDGKLDAALRGPLEDHISRCEDCYFVVKETAALWAETGAAGSSLGEADAPERGAQEVVPIDRGGPGAAPVSPRSRASFVRRYVLPMAATLVVGAGSLTLWRQAHPAETYVDAVRPLVEAVGERRFFEPRLTGGFKYGPAVSFKRSSGSAPDSKTWEMLAAAGELHDRPETPSFAARGGRGAAALFLGDVDLAVSVYSQLLRDDPRTAEWPSNLAAALLVRGAGDAGTKDRRDEDKQEALRHAEAAVRMDSSLKEAQFNRGLALKMLGRADEARQAFAEIERQGGSWGPAARDQLRDIEETSKRRP